MIAQNIINTQPTERTAFYQLPKFLGQIEHITTVDTGGLEFVICCDKIKLFIFPLIPGSNKPLGTIHQSLPIPNIKSLRTIAKNYLMIETQNKYIGIFEIIKSTSKQVPTQKPINSLQVNAVKVEFSEVLKWRIFSCYFVRQVMQNLFEVQVFFTDLQFEIFQFTNKNKRGSMSFSISPNGKIQKSNKRQLYGSKCFFNIGRKLMYWLKNFSDKQFILQEIVQQQPAGGNKLLTEPFGYFGIQRAEQYKCIYGNLVVRDCINPAKRHPLKLQKQSFLNDLKAQVASLSPAKKRSTAQQNPFNELVQQSTSMQNISQLLQSYKITNFTDFMMVQNKCKKQMQVYQIKADGSQLIGKQDSHVLLLNQSKQNKTSVQNTDNSLLELRKWQWYFGNSKKLIAIDRLGFRLKYIQQISPDNRNQNKIQAEVTNLSQKMDEIKQEPSNQDQKSVQNQPQVESQNLTNQINENSQEIIIQQKRKFSKDQLQKFCQEFKDQDADKYVNKQLIKKVDEVNHWVKTEVLTIQKVSQSIKGLRPTLQTMAKQQKKQEKILQNQNKGVKQAQKNQSQKSNISEAKTQDVSSKTNSMQVNEQQQGVINLKQKPPMKIIQRNKISVAKTFNSQNGNQSKANQQQNKQQVKRQTLQTKQQKQTQKNTIEAIKKPQTSSPTTFVKYRLKQEPINQANNNEKQKKRFMKNYLNHDKKQQNIQKTIKKQEQQKIAKKIQQSQQRHIQHKKIQVPQKVQTQQKQEKIKFNVITRASLMKKKQEYSVKQTKVQTKEKQKDVKIQQMDKSQKAEKCSPVNQQKQQKLNQQTKNQSRKASQQQNNLIEHKSPKSQGQVQPKTKFVPSIDINKASTNQLNECQFLSQDSISEQDNKQNEKKAGQFSSQQEEQQIQQQIQGDQNIVSSDQQPDLEHLIDDNIVENKQQKNDIKPQNSQVVKNESIELQKQKVLSKKQQQKQIDQQEEIQKFCNTLLEQQPVTKNNKKESISSATKQKGVNPTQKIQIINFNNLSNIKSQIPSKLTQQKSQCINPQPKSEQNNQMNQFNSLLFKTSIKRTNIFSSQMSQNEDKSKQNSTLTQNKPVLAKELQTENNIKQIDQTQEKKSEQQKKAQTQIPIKNQSQTNKSSQQKVQQTKKSNDWYQSSSEQNIDGQQKQNQQFQQKNLQISNQINQPSQNNQILPDEKAEKISQIQKQKIQQKNNQGQQTQCKLDQQEKLKEQFIDQQLLTRQEIKQSQKYDNDSQITNNISSNSSLSNPTTVSGNTQTVFLNNPIPPAHWLTNRPPANMTTKKDANPFINFKKSSHDHQQISQQNIFSVPPNNLPPVPNSNLFKKFLNQRQNKNGPNIKSQQNGLPIPAEGFQIKMQIKKQQIKHIVSGKQQKKSQQIKSQQIKSQQLMIPTSALPQIQQLISRYEQTTLENLEKQQKNIVKSLQQIPKTHNPYNKNNSLILPQQIKQEIIKQSKNSLKKWLSTKMLDKIQVSFRQIMQQHKAIYEQALKYYENEARRKITTMQLQYEQQSSILTDIENVSSNMCAALQSTILQGEQLHTYQLKQWKREIQQKQTNIIDPLAQKIQDTKFFFDSRNKNLQVMTNQLKQIKDILKQKLKKKQQLKQIKQKRKIQKQQKMKQKVQQELNKKIKIKQQSKKQSKIRRNAEQPQQDRVQFYNQPSQRQQQSPYYGNQPYPYY